MTPPGWHAPDGGACHLLELRQAHPPASVPRRAPQAAASRRPCVSRRAPPAPAWPGRQVDGVSYPGLGYFWPGGYPSLGNSRRTPFWVTRKAALNSVHGFPARKAKPRTAANCRGFWGGRLGALAVRRQSPARSEIVGSRRRTCTRLNVECCWGTASADLSPSRHHFPAGPCTVGATAGTLHSATERLSAATG